MRLDFGKRAFVLSDELLETMRDLITATVMSGDERGCNLCERTASGEAVIESGARCVGDACSVDIPIRGCPPGTNEVGAFHTHPVDRMGDTIASPLVESIGDTLAALLAASQSKRADALNCRGGILPSDANVERWRMGAVCTYVSEVPSRAKLALYRRRYNKEIAPIYEAQERDNARYAAFEEELARFAHEEREVRLA